MQGVVPIVGSADVKTVLQADNWISFSDSVIGSGSIEVYPFTAGQSVGINNSSGDFEVYYLNNLASTFSSVIIGDNTNTNGIVSSDPEQAFSVNSPITFQAGAGTLKFTNTLTTGGVDVTFEVSGDSNVTDLDLGAGGIIKMVLASFPSAESKVLQVIPPLTQGRWSL